MKPKYEFLTGTVEGNVLKMNAEEDNIIPAIYNLQGVRLNNLRKGVNIVGGKKVIIK